ncbi:RNI-like protein [Hyaloscypha hepaticicola]|uniref:RNI-like protein n=1 Tax=Hyaloscypha hepaticicola TaxID=2082293 RepID=A0A2J6PKN2_9HELO|nr:RNI-like protein [Hyaloscypha hepaticicola]
MLQARNDGPRAASIPPTYYIGQRVSFESNLCTIRYIGAVEGTDKVWLGVEWDEPSRGKHDGSHKGKRYFKCMCQSPSPTAASFLRTTRLKDEEQTFLEAVHSKYADYTPSILTDPTVVQISGKVVEEVGFDKIREQQSQLHELKIVLVDGMRINAGRDPRRHSAISIVCPSILELDLSRNLFEKFQQIDDIIGQLGELRKLRLNGNRLQDLGDNSSLARNVRPGTPPTNEITELELDNMLISWDAIKTIVTQFPVLVTLSASSNYFKSLSCPLPNGIRSLTLEYNEFTMIWDIILLRQLESLEVLHLKGNKISSIDKEGYQLSSFHAFGTKLRYVDLSYNTIASWSFIDDLPQVFPGLEELRLSHNPIYSSNGSSKQNESIEEGYMLTLARLKNLKSLNFSKITAEDRSNAEMFYLSRIAKAMAEVPESEEHIVTSQHKRFAELSKQYGAPTVVRKSGETINPDFLEARLIKFTFYLPANTRAHQAEAITNVQEIPKTFDVYRVKGILGKTFDIHPMKIRLIWETGEWDPVAGYGDDEGDSDDEEGGVPLNEAQRDGAITPNGRWMERKTEIEDSIRQIGFCVDGMEAKVRIELR